LDPSTLEMIFRGVGRASIAFNLKFGGKYNFLVFHAAAAYTSDAPYSSANC